jgi:Protein of unknown function (DUF3105)
MSDRRTSTPSRLTKAERKEQARRERVELQRKMARARRTRTIVIAVIAVLAVGITAFAVTRPKPVAVGPQALLAQAAAAAKSAGCGSVQETPPYQPASSDREHIGVGQEMPPLSSYATVPPTSGPHNPSPLGAGVYPTAPPIDRVIHSLEHGAAIVWYSPDAPSAVIDKITTFYRDHPTAGSRVIVAPYDYPDQGDAGHLPAGTQMSLVAWHELEDCVHPSLPAAFDFTARYAFPSFGDQRYLGKAPEPGGTM